MSKTYKRNSYRKPKQHGQVFDKKSKSNHQKEKNNKHLDDPYQPDVILDE